MNTQHTPGPWKHDPQFDTVSGSNHSLICKVATGEDRGEEEANARLIAAAPELLAACEAISRELEYAYGGHGQMPSMEAKFYEQARAAIAKAKGTV